MTEFYDFSFVWRVADESFLPLQRMVFCDEVILKLAIQSRYLVHPDSYVVRNLMKTRLLLVVVAALSVSLSCSRDPKVVARKYIESGNRYFEAGKYKEASLMYRNAAQKQPKSGEAHYRMGLMAIKMGDGQAALASFRRAIEPDSGLTGAERIDAELKCAELLLAVRPAEGVPFAKDKYTKLLQDDPNSYAGHRLRASWRIMSLAYRTHNREEISRDEYDREMNQALADYRRALEIKPLDPEVTLTMVQHLIGRKQEAEAAQLLESLIAKGGASPSAYESLAGIHFRANRFADSEKVLRKGIDEHLGQKTPAADRSSYGLLLVLADVYRSQNRRDEMVKTLDRLKTYASAYPLAYSAVASFYARINEPENAVRQYDEGIQALPKQKLELQGQKMLLLAMQRKHTEAAALANEILKENPKDPNARTLRASLELGKEDAAKTMKDLQEVLAQQPRNWLAQYSLGRVYLMRGEMENARKQFSQALSFRANHVGSLIGLAQAQAGLREFKPALDNANTVLVTDPKNLQARLVRTAAMAGLGQTGQARTELTSMLRERPDTTDAMFQLGLLSRYEKKLGEAENWFQKAYSARPENLRTLVALVDTMLAANQGERAVQFVRAQAQKDPARTELREMVGNLLMRTGKPDDAIAEYKAAADAVVSKDKSAAVRLYLKSGEVYRMKGDHATAVKIGEMTRSLDGRNFQALAFLALAYDGAGRSQDAAKVYEDAIKLEPNNVVMLNNYAYLLAQTGGSLDTALGYAQRAMQSRPEVDEIADTLGLIYMKKQLTTDAIEMFQKVVTKHPNNAMYRYHLAMALDQKGDRAEARKHVQIALQNNPPAGEVENMKRLLEK